MPGRFPSLSSTRYTFHFGGFIGMKYKTFAELTVSDYQQLYSVVASDDDELNKSVACVSIITGLPRWEVEELPLPEFNQANDEISTIFSMPLPEDKPNNSV